MTSIPPSVSLTPEMPATTSKTAATEDAGGGPTSPPRRRPPIRGGGTTPRLDGGATRRRRNRSTASTMTAAAAAAAFAAALIPAVSGHGYLKTPRSRNLVAYQDKNYEMPDGNEPKPEDCPHCLNRGGKLAQCGILHGVHNGDVWERNYDKPLNIQGEPMKSNLQGVYREGGEIEVEVLVTTHHKGHFEFAACPIEDTVPMPVPTEECFRRNKLQFISDEEYGAPVDPNYPERAYIAPASLAEYEEPLEGVQPVVGAYYKMKFQLPQGLAGNVVLLQWYYLTANSCKHEGYANYPFPEEWGSDVKLYPGLPDCGEVPPDGNGVPEQFWNCAEIRIVGRGGSQPRPAITPYGPVTNDMVAMTAAVPVTPPPTPAPVPKTPRPTSAPTPFQPCQNSASTYYEATEDCSGYYICMSGTQGQVYRCAGNSQLYDQEKQMCNWADEVNCGGGPNNVDPAFDEDGNPLPTKSPTPAPTGKPNELLEWTPKTAEERGHDKTIIAYYASWQWYDRNGLAEPAAFDWNKITRANFAFFQITEQGDIFGTDMWADPITLFGFYDWMAEEGTVEEYCSWDEPGAAPNCMAHKYREGLIYLAHQAGAEVYPSIGGWSLSDPFVAMAADEGSRKHFAEQCVELIKSYNFDGIDLDWEYPGYEPHSGTPEDTVNFNLLLDDVRAALDGLEAQTGKFYGLTAALPCGPSIIDNQDIAHVGRLLTELNLMTYDFHGSWNEKTGVNAPLYDQEDSPEFSVHGCVNNWLEGGAPKHKINIGFPFYGRSFLRAEHLYEEHEGADDTTWHMDEGVPQYYNIMDKFSGYTSVRDERTMTQYMYGNTGMVSYDDERAICDKTEYAQVRDLNGYIIWEISGDLMPDLSTPLLDAANAKLHDPDMDCASLDLSDSISSIMDEKHPQSEGGPGGGGGGGAPEVVYYPDFGGSMCNNDGKQPDWLKTKDITHTAEDCCSLHFKWNKPNCLDKSPDPPPPPPEPVATPKPTPEPVASPKRSPKPSPKPDIAPIVESQTQAENEVVYYPSSMGHGCLSDGKQPKWLTVGSMFDNEEDCCKHHFPGEDCGGHIVAQKSLLYYPSSTGFMCLSDGNQPSWLQADFMYDNEEDCCKYNFPTRDCIGRADMKDSLIFYPSATGYECLSDGKQPSWISAESMFGSEEDCCKHNFPDQDCVGKAMADEGKPLLYYPSSKGTECLRDGKQPSWLSMDNMFGTQEECCGHHYEWKQDCVTNKRPSTPEGNTSDTIPLVSSAAEVQTAPDPSPTRDPTPEPSRGTPPSRRPTQHPTPHPSRKPAPQTKRPTRHPTPRPSRRPVSDRPTDKPLSMAGMHQSAATLVGMHLDEPGPTPQTKRPARRPSPRPTGKVLLTSPTFAYEIFQTEPTIGVIQRPDPTRRPTKKPKQRNTPRPTRRSPRPTNGNQDTGASPIAASYLGNAVIVEQPSPIAASYLGLPSSESHVVIVEQQRPGKGSEHQQLGDSIKNQIQQQMMIATTKQQKNGVNKKGKRGQKKKGAKRKEKKRQKKLKEKTRNAQKKMQKPKKL